MAAILMVASPGPAPAAQASGRSAGPQPSATQDCPFPTDALTPSGDPGSSRDLLRHDGRIDQFMVAPQPGIRYQPPYSVWYRPQLTPGGAYGCWISINKTEVRTKAGKRYVIPIEDTDGRIQVFYDTNGISTNRIYQAVPDGPWLEESFSAASPPYWGNPSVFPLLDGRFGFVNTSKHVAEHEVGVWYVAQSSPAGPWGPWVYLGRGPFRSTLAYTSEVVSRIDGTVHLIGMMWAAPDDCIAYIDQYPNGDWSPWRPDPASPAGCT